MRRALIISTVAHAVAIGWGLVSFATRLHETPPVDSMPIDIISADQLSKITAGAKTGEKDKAKPLVEKVAEPKPVDDPMGKISEKKEITTASAPEPPPKPAEKPPEKKPEPKPVEKAEQPKPKDEAKPVEKKPEPKVDPIAEALKKDEAKKPKPKQEARTPPPQPQQPKQEQKFDATRIAALLDKRDPQRHAATGETLNMAPALGTSRGNAAQLSQSELDALRARLMQLWNPPVGNQNPEELIVRVRIQLTQDGKLAGPPMVLTSGNSVRFQTARDSAIRAVFRAQPYNMLRKETYETWKDIEVTFDPRDMFRG